MSKDNQNMYLLTIKSNAMNKEKTTTLTKA